MMMQLSHLLAVVSLSLLSALMMASSGGVALAEDDFSEPEAEDFAYPRPTQTDRPGSSSGEGA